MKSARNYVENMKVHFWAVCVYAIVPPAAAAALQCYLHAPRTCV